MKIKRGGAYFDASPFIKRGGVYGAVSALVKSGGGYLAAGQVVSENNPPVISGAIDLGQLTVGAAVEVTSAQLLAGAVDPNGDALTVEALAVTSGSATLTGTGPWTLTPTAAGAVVLSYTISDGMGGSVGQVAQAVAVAADDYTRRHDYLGLYRARANSFVSWWTLPALTYTANTDAMDYYIGVRVESDEPGLVGTVEDNVLTRGSSSSRNRIWRLADGTVRINSLNNITLTISDPGAWPLNEICRFWIRDFASQILLYKMDSNGDYQLLKTTAKGTFDIFSPLYLMGNAIKYHGACYYAAAVVNGSTVYDFRFDEMTGAVARSAHNSAVTAAYTAGAGGPIGWIDDTPFGLYPVPDFAVSGSKTHGSTITITTPTLTFAGGMPQYQIYDDGVGKSGQVGAAATIGTWAQISNPSALQQYRTTGGPNNKPYFVWVDGATGERLARIADPGFAFSEMFYARQFRVPTGYAWTGTANDGGPWTPVVGVIPNDSTQKQGWGMTADDGGGTGSDLVLGTHIFTDTFKNAGNSNALGGAAMAGGLKLNEIVVWGEWMGFAGYAKHNSAAPTQGNHQMIAASTLGKTKKLDSVGSVLCAERGFPQFEIFIDGAWFDDNSLCRMESAENYIALGDNASCIVIVGNAARMQDCTKLAFSPPTAWAGQAISARFSSGDLNLSGDLFVYILQANGALLSQYGVQW